LWNSRQIYTKRQADKDNQRPDNWGSAVLDVYAFVTSCPSSISMDTVFLVRNMKAHTPFPVSLNLGIEEVVKDELKGRRRTCESTCFKAPDTTQI